MDVEQMVTIPGVKIASEEEKKRQAILALEVKIMELGYDAQNGAALWRGQRIVIPEDMQKLLDVDELRKYIIGQIQLMLPSGNSSPSIITFKPPFDYSSMQQAA